MTDHDAVKPPIDHESSREPAHPAPEDALRGLPAFDMKPNDASKAERAALAAFEDAHGRGDGEVRLGAGIARFAVPFGLAAVVVVYLSWAVSAATALQQ